MSGLRLWLDLLADLTVSIPAEYHHQRLAIIGRSVQPDFSGRPLFQLLESESPRPGALLSAALLLLVAVGSVSLAMNLRGSYQPSSFAATPQHPSDENSSTLWHPARQTADAKGEVAAPEEPNIIAGNAKRDAGKYSAVLPGRFTSPANSAPQAQDPQPKPHDATSAMIQLFQTHNIVMFGEVHGNKQEYEWLCKLVKAPGFADRVDDIVVEHGNSLYQATVDRYVAGENVPFDQVQKAWRNMIASVPAVSPAYGWFYRAVREANLRHRGRHQIRLLMGSPPGDWEKIKTPQDLAPYEAEREQWYAQVVKDNVLTKHHRALLIMGAGHFLRGHSQVLQDELLFQQHRPVPPLNRAQLGPDYIERTLRNAGANPYLIVFGTNVADNQGDADERFASWPTPAIASLSGNWLGRLPAQPVTTCGRALQTPLTLADEADAMLYVAPCADLTDVNVPRSELDGTPYGKEVARRAALILALPPQRLQ
ncbi:MAG TPA: hypothetical protein VGM02_07290 [Acidobacteriaceae bacterium]